MGHALLPSEPAGPLGGIAADSQGRVFAFENGMPGKLSVLENGRWRQFVPFWFNESKAQPRSLQILRDGRLAVVWSAGRGRWLLTLLKGETVVQSVSFVWSLSEFCDVEITEDSTGGVWVSGANPVAIRVLLPKAEVMRYDLTPFQRKSSKPQWNMVHLLEDGAGGQWLWSSNTSDTSAGVDRPVRVDGGRLVPMGEIPGLQGQAIKDMRVKDRGNLWFVTRKGLYDVSLNPPRATQVPGPASDVSIQSIVPFGDRWIVITSGGASESAIWELLPTGWGRHLVQAKVQSMSRYRHSTPYYLNTSSGILIAAKTGWVWMPRSEGDARVVDERDAWPLGRPGDMVSLGGDRLFARGSSSEWPPGMEFRVSDFIGPEKSPPFLEWEPWQGWAVDSRERAFTLLDKSGQLGVLTNMAWSYVPLPKGFYEGHHYTILADARDRAWVVQLDQECMPVWILSSDLKSWETLPNFDAALEKYGADVGSFGSSFSGLHVAGGPRGQVAYQSRNRKLRYWNGSTWREWWIDDIAGSRTGDPVLPPFFSPEGDLCVNTLHSGSTRRLIDGSEWSTEARRENPDALPPKASATGLPTDFPCKDGAAPSVLADTTGRQWVLADGQLFVCREGKTSRLLCGEHVRALDTASELTEVRFDKRGNTWLRFGKKIPSIVMMPKPSRTKPTARVTVDESGVARLECATDFFVDYRAGDGGWQALKEPSVTIDSFFEGDREIEVRFFSPELEEFGAQKIAYRCGISLADRFRKAADAFAMGDDGAREAAIRLMKNKPAEALAVLKEWKPESETEKWWIEAAVQECEREAAKRR